MSLKTYNYKINGNPYNVTIDSIEGNIADITVNGKSYKVEMEKEDVKSAPTTVIPRTISTKIKAVASNKEKAVKAPLPGIISSVNVNVGDVVKVGQVVATLEAMKMENEIESEFSGTVTSVKVGKGDSILEGAAIVTIA